MWPRYKNAQIPRRLCPSADRTSTGPRLVNRGSGFDNWAHPVYGDTMNARLTLDAAGRVVIPKGLRDELHLQPGDEFDLETSGDQMTLRPVRIAPPLSKEQGVWVFRTGHPLPASVTDEVLERTRRTRGRESLSSSK